jgi:excisionase family DNA binding protein
VAEGSISISQAARRLGVALPYVYQLVWAGKLDARKVDGQWQVSEKAVESRLKARCE